MARFLRDVSIHLGSGQELPVGLGQRDFNITTHTVQDIFLYMIPNRFEFGNILKLNINIKGTDAVSSEVMNFDGYVNYDYIGFDFENYFRVSKEEQNVIILEVLRDVLIRVPEFNAENKEIALAITDKISEQNFKYSFESKLSKQQRSKSHKAIVEIHIDDEGQNAYLRIEQKDGVIIFETFLLKNTVYEFHNNLHKSKWQKDKFVIMDRDGGIYREFEIKKEANTELR
jgi:hypothetical protein